MIDFCNNNLIFNIYVMYTFDLFPLTLSYTCHTLHNLHSFSTKNKIIDL